MGVCAAHLQPPPAALHQSLHPVAAHLRTELVMDAVAHTEHTHTQLQERSLLSPTLSADHSHQGSHLCEACKEWVGFTAAMGSGSPDVPEEPKARNATMEQRKYEQPGHSALKPWSQRPRRPDPGSPAPQAPAGTLRLPPIHGEEATPGEPG